MSDLQDYFSTPREVAKLKKEVAKLKSELKKSNYEKSAIKREYEKLKRDKLTGNLSRTAQASILVQKWINGDKSLTFKRIAELHNLSVETVNNISYRLRHAKQYRGEHG